MTPTRTPRSHLRARHRAVLTAVAVAGVALLTAAPASAHVSVTPDTVAKGSSTELTFRVPNEEADASTTKVTVQVPTAHPIAQVLAKPIPGWSVTTKTVKLTTPLVTDDGKFTSVVSLITWSGGRIDPGQYQDFAISADPLPDKATQLVFKTLQTYSNGDVVRWIDLQQKGQDEPEHPAPVLNVTSAAATEGTGTAATSQTTPARSSSTDPSSTWPGVVAVVSLVVALLAAIGAGVSLRRSRTTG